MLYGKKKISFVQNKLRICEVLTVGLIWNTQPGEYLVMHSNCTFEMRVVFKGAGFYNHSFWPMIKISCNFIINLPWYNSSFFKNINWKDFVLPRVAELFNEVVFCMMINNRYLIYLLGTIVSKVWHSSSVFFFN